MEKKMTKATAWGIVKNIVAESNHPQSAELLAKKNSAEKKPTAQQVQNDGIKSAILSAMESNRHYTVTEIIKEVPECADLTNQRVSALLRQMKDEGAIVRTEDKRKAYFSKA